MAAPKYEVTLRIIPRVMDKTSELGGRRSTKLERQIVRQATLYNGVISSHDYIVQSDVNNNVV